MTANPIKDRVCSKCRDKPVSFNLCQSQLTQLAVPRERLKVCCRPERQSVLPTKKFSLYVVSVISQLCHRTHKREGYYKMKRKEKKRKKYKSEKEKKEEGKEKKIPRKKRKRRGGKAAEDHQITMKKRKKTNEEAEKEGQKGEEAAAENK